MTSTIVQVVWVSGPQFQRPRIDTQGVIRIIKMASRLLQISFSIPILALLAAREDSSGGNQAAYAIAATQLPAGATTERTDALLGKVDDFFVIRSGVDKVVTILGFGFDGNGQNAGISFATFKDWSERGPADSSDAIVGSALGALAGLPEGSVFTLTPPPIAALGNASGFSFRLQNRGNLGNAALVEAANGLLMKAWQSPVLQYPYIEGLPPAAQIVLDIDRRKANAYGITFDAINTVLSTSIGSRYIGDFPNAGRMQRVIVQAEAA